MPPASRKRKSPSLEIQGQPPDPKRRRASQASTSSTPGSRRSVRLQHATLIIPDSDDDPFLEDEKPTKHDEEDIIDLATRDELPAPPTPAKKSNRVEFAAFQCAICMDNATNLAVTHCGASPPRRPRRSEAAGLLTFYLGHMFCSECLQSALQTDATRNKCPICRQKIDHKERETYNSRTKGFWHLELKPMTANKKGKQPSRP